MSELQRPYYRDRWRLPKAKRYREGPRGATRSGYTPFYFEGDLIQYIISRDNLGRRVRLTFANGRLILTTPLSS